jgi:hypothetical protein
VHGEEHLATISPYFEKAGLSPHRMFEFTDKAFTLGMENNVYYQANF